MAVALTIKGGGGQETGSPRLAKADSGSEWLVDSLVVPRAGASRRQRVTKRGQDPLRQDHLRHPLSGRFPPPLGLGVCMFETSPLGVLMYSSLKALGHRRHCSGLGTQGRPGTDHSSLASCWPQEKEKCLLRQGEWTRWVLGVC